jgi:O-acetyl-ADP-ribose deacetylase (regulator of RNase III)
MEFSVIQGDITEQRADTLVNAANTDIQTGGDVAGAVQSAAGDAIQEEADQKPSLDLGGTVETDACDLEAEYIVHTATMEFGCRESLSVTDC